jgi:hypothetical protein
MSVELIRSGKFEISKDIQPFYEDSCTHCWALYSFQKEDMVKIGRIYFVKCPYCGELTNPAYGICKKENIKGYR